MNDKTQPETPGNQEVPQEIADMINREYSLSSHPTNYFSHTVEAANEQCLNNRKVAQFGYKLAMPEIAKLQAENERLKSKLAGIKSLIDQTIALHPYKQERTAHSQGWEDGLSHLDSRIDEMMPDSVVSKTESTDNKIDKMIRAFKGLKAILSETEDSFAVFACEKIDDILWNAEPPKQ